MIATTGGPCVSTASLVGESPRRTSTAMPAAIQTSMRAVRVVARVTPVVAPNPSTSATVAVPAWSTPIRSGTILKTTLTKRFAASKTNASTSVGARAPIADSTTNASVTARTWNDSSSAATSSTRGHARG